MSTYKRGNTWCARIWYQGRKIEKAIGPDRKVAEAVQKELERERALAEAAGQEWTGLSRIRKVRESRTFQQAFDNYLAVNESNFKPSTLQTYKDHVRAHLRIAFGTMPVAKITKEKIIAFRNELVNSRKSSSNKPLSPARVNNIMNLLNAVLNHCIECELISENPAAKVKRLRNEDPDIDPFQLDELHLILNTMESHYRPIFTVLAWTGMRPNELKALRWEDIDWRRKEIKISKGVFRGKESTTKSKAGKRIIPMHPEVWTALEAVKNRPLCNMEGVIFTSKRGQPLSHHLDDIWRRALKKAKFRHRPSYQLRHTWASMALMTGEDPLWVSKMLGHSNAAIMWKHYARFMPSDKHGQKIATVGKFANQSSNVSII
jgi:integrase